MKIGVYFNEHKVERKKLENILSKMSEFSINVSFTKEINELEEKITDDVDFLMVFGGDGTVLKVLHEVMENDIPVLGVNFGKLGFLTSYCPEDMKELLKIVIGRKYKIIELPVFEVIFKNERFKGINDLVLFKSSTSGIIEIGIGINDKNLGLIPADGVVICTPIGSTAYNLSNGGAILHPSVKAFEVSFIAPHVMSARPIVIGFKEKIKLFLKNEDNAEILIDGFKIEEMKSGDILEVKMSSSRAKLMVLGDTNYCKLLVEKLGWGRR